MCKAQICMRDRSGVYKRRKIVGPLKRVWKRRPQVSFVLLDWRTVRDFMAQSFEPFGIGFLDEFPTLRNDSRSQGNGRRRNPGSYHKEKPLRPALVGCLPPGRYMSAFYLFCRFFK